MGGLMVSHSKLRKLHKKAARPELDGVEPDTNRAQMYPIKLKDEPLIEAIWEIRFQSTKGPVYDLLPGLIHARLGRPETRAHRLRAANLPLESSDNDPKLRYVPRMRMEHKNEAIQVGSHMVSLHSRRPYVGWQRFSGRIGELVQVLKATELIDHLERFSLKYVDLIALDESPTLDWLDVAVTLANNPILTAPILLRTEMKEEECTQIIQVVCPAEVTFPGSDDRTEGLLLEIDTIMSLRGESSWDEMTDSIESVHDKSKARFFDLLAENTLAKLRPVYPQGEQGERSK
jgi:uncharacterized protein (TIGR04255 family)